MPGRLAIVSVAGLLVLAWGVGPEVRKPHGAWSAMVNAASAEPSDAQKTTGPPAAPPPTREERIGAGEDYARKLLLLMDTDKNGKVSKQEFMSFMSAEFDRMDVNHDGMLDVKELTGLRVKSFVGK